MRMQGALAKDIDQAGPVPVPVPVPEPVPEPVPLPVPAQTASQQSKPGNHSATAQQTDRGTGKPLQSTVGKPLEVVKWFSLPTRHRAKTVSKIHFRADLIKLIGNRRLIDIDEASKIK